MMPEKTPYQDNWQRAHKALVDAKYSLAACAHDASVSDGDRETAHELYGATCVAIQFAATCRPTT